MTRTADRLSLIRESMILGLVRKARELKTRGLPVIDLGIGEPDFTTPEHVKAAAIAAIQADDTRYTVVPGTRALRDAIVRKFKRDNGLDYTLEQITVSGGAKQSIFNALLATMSPGDEAIVPSPYWSSYPDIIGIAEGTPVFVECPQEQRFLITPEQLETAITPRTKWLMLNSPSNPTGGVYGRDHLQALAEVLRRHPQVMIMSDDIYEHLMFDAHRFTSILSVAPDLANRVLLINGVSKVFAMTGWRIGYAAGPSDIIAAMNKVQSQCNTHACSISQAASVAALDGPMDFCVKRSDAFQARRDLVVDSINAVGQLSALRPEGAFYVYPSCAGAIGQVTPDGRTLTSDVDFCTWLLEEHHVSTVPGAAFGLSPHFRISTAASMQDLRTACSRIAQACEELRK